MCKEGEWSARQAPVGPEDDQGKWQPRIIAEYL